jgi:hypothetical protein
MSTFSIALNPTKLTDARRTASISVTKESRLFFGIESKESLVQSDQKLLNSAADTNNLVTGGATGPTDKLEKLRILVENKKAQGTSYNKTSRLYQSENCNQKLVKRFIKRRQEVDELLRLTDKIKTYILDNKQTLIKERQ